MDDHGELWLKIAERNGNTVVVGLTPSNILAPNSDRQLAYQILLATVNEQLKSSARRRETMPEFKQIWALLEKANPQNRTYVANRETRFTDLP